MHFFKSWFGWMGTLVLLSGGSLLAEQGDESEAASPPEEMVGIYLFPSTDSPRLGTIATAELDQFPSDVLPLEDQLRARGWRSFVLPLEFNGYIHRRYLRKDMTVALETPVFLEPEQVLENMLTVVERDDEVEVLEIEKDWVKIYIAKSAQAAFVRRDNWPGEEVIAEDMEEEEEEIPFELESERMDFVDTRRETARPPAGSPDLDEPFEGTMRYYEGVLGRNRQVMGRGPQQPYSLLDNRGRRIAVLDVDRLLQTTSMERHIGRPISVFGLLTETNGGQYPLIVVESFRVR